MKHIFFISMIFGFCNPILGQNIPYQNSPDTNFKFFQGRLANKILDSGTYIYATSQHCSFIEFTSFRKGIMMVKYRVEMLFNPHVFVVTKTYARNSDSIATYFLAIDSNMFNAINIKKEHFKEFTNKNIYWELNLEDSVILSLFSKFIKEHNLQTEYFYFKPRSFVAWLRIGS
jgi:hypothetical protein